MNIATRLGIVLMFITIISCIIIKPDSTFDIVVAGVYIFGSMGLVLFGE